MKRMKSKKTGRMALTDANFRQNIRLTRFIREIQREDPLDNDLIKTMEEFRFQVV